MSVQHAGSIIRQARLNAGLTQEQLSDGVCSTLSLSRIENGSAGVSPATFPVSYTHLLELTFSCILIMIITCTVSGKKDRI